MNMTKQDLSELTGLSYRQIFNINKKLVEAGRDSLFVRGDGDGYDLATFVRRWIDYRVEAETENAGDLEAVKAAHEAVKMRKTQLEVDRMENSLVEAREVRRVWGDIANAVMQNLLRLPGTLAPQLSGMENTDLITSLLDSEIRKVLTALSDLPLPGYLLAAEEDETDGEDV